MTPFPTATSTSPPSTFTPTATIEYFAPTAIPTLSPPPIFTPDAIQVESWQEYQAELAKVLLYGYGPEAYKGALCEWDILGQSNQEAYLWVACISADGLWLESLPVVIYLKHDEAIREVNIPNIEIDRHTQTETYDLHLFPINIQEKLCLYYFYGYVPQCNSITSKYFPVYHLRPGESSLLSHLKYRKEHRDEPPLIVLSATPTP
jgi:hypothetical protein